MHNHGGRNGAAVAAAMAAAAATPQVGNGGAVGGSSNGGGEGNCGGVSDWFVDADSANPNWTANMSPMPKQRSDSLSKTPNTSGTRDLFAGFFQTGTPTPLGDFSCYERKGSATTLPSAW